MSIIPEIIYSILYTTTDRSDIFCYERDTVTSPVSIAWWTTSRAMAWRHAANGWEMARGHFVRWRSLNAGSEGASTRNNTSAKPFVFFQPVVMRHGIARAWPTERFQTTQPGARRIDRSRQISCHAHVKKATQTHRLAPRRQNWLPPAIEKTAHALIESQAVTDNKNPHRRAM